MRLKATKNEQKYFKYAFSTLNFSTKVNGKTIFLIIHYPNSTYRKKLDFNDKKTYLAASIFGYTFSDLYIKYIKFREIGSELLQTSDDLAKIRYEDHKKTILGI